MFHTLAWSESIADVTLTDLNTVADPIIQTQNAHFLPPDDMSVYAGVAYATNLQRVRVTTPRLRQISPIFLRPIQPSLVGAQDANHFLLDRNPLRFRGQEEIQVEAIQNSGGAQQVTVVAFLGSGLYPVPTGDVFVVRATSTTTAVANTWTQLAYTLDSLLPAGRYGLALVESISTNSQAVRCIFDQQYWRPGAPGLSSVTQRLPTPWYEYFLGSWGTFVTYSLPRIEVLCNGADNSFELYLHVIPLGG